MPHALIRKMKAGGVTNPWALLNAAGARGVEDEGEAKRRLSRYMKRKKAGRKAASDFKRKKR